MAQGIVAAGGVAAAAEVDALDEPAVDRHLRSVIERAGRVDVSFNAVGLPDATILGVPLVELDLEQFSLPIAAYTRSYFLTARLAAPCRTSRPRRASPPRDRQKTSCTAPSWRCSESERCVPRTAPSRWRSSNAASTPRRRPGRRVCS